VGSTEVRPPGGLSGVERLLRQPADTGSDDAQFLSRRVGCADRTARSSCARIVRIQGAGQPGSVTLRGSVREGVETGCVLLVTDDGQTYLLLGGDRGLLNGENRLEVVGTVTRGIATTCQQGIPLTVTSMRVI